MIFNDFLYGNEEINEPLLIDLIQSKPVQRLKGICQFGVPDRFYSRKNYMRFEHSMGVLILLRRLNAGLKEQAAGILHDISHTAFSHVVDGAIGDPTKEDFQDKMHFQIMRDSEVPEILDSYGMDFKEISELERFPLLERDSPDLCVDRLDYSLREMKINNMIDSDILSGLSVNSDEIVFNDADCAKKYSFNYLYLQKNHLGEESVKIRYHLLANTVRAALERNKISFNDLFKTDDEVIDLLEKSGDEEILRNLRMLEGEIRVAEDNNSDIVLRKKFRYVNPKVESNNQILMVSEFCDDYKKAIEFERENSKIERRVRII